MEKNNGSSINLLNGKMNFDPKDPYWYRIIVLLIVAVFIFLIMKEWAIPALAAKGVNLIGWLKMGKGRSP